MQSIQSQKVIPAALSSIPAELHSRIEKILVLLHADGLGADPGQQAQVNAKFAELFRLIVKLKLPHEETVKAAKAVSYYRNSLDKPLMVSRELVRFTKRLFVLIQWTPAKLSPTESAANVQREPIATIAESESAAPVPSTREAELLLGI